MKNAGVPLTPAALPAASSASISALCVELSSAFLHAHEKHDGHDDLVDSVARRDLHVGYEVTHARRRVLRPRNARFQTAHTRAKSLEIVVERFDFVAHRVAT